MPTTPPSPTLFELETDLYTPSPTTPKGSLSPPSSSSSPHETILWDKYNKGIITLEEYHKFLQGKTTMACRKFKTDSNCPASTPTHDAI